MSHAQNIDFNLLKWIAATFYGWLIGFVLIIIFAMLLDSIGLNAQFFVGTGIAGGVGFLQARYLRKMLSWNWEWMWVSVIGMTASFLFFDLGASVLQTEAAFNLPASIVLGSIFVGVLQFRILRSKSFIKGRQWILISFLAWSSAGLMVVLSNFINLFFAGNPFSIVPFLLLIIVCASLSLGWVSGKGLKVILEKQNSLVEDQD